MYLVTHGLEVDVNSDKVKRKRLHGSAKAVVGQVWGQIYGV